MGLCDRRTCGRPGPTSGPDTRGLRPVPRLFFEYKISKKKHKPCESKDSRHKERKEDLHMRKNDYIATRKAALETLTVADLAATIVEYFSTHATMPGEKDLKSASMQIVANIAENPDFTIGDEVRESMIDAFANIVVREMKLEKLQVANITKANKEDFSILKPTDLDLVEVASIPAVEKAPAKKIYEIGARIVGGEVRIGEFVIGSLSKGFAVNNPGTDCEATLIATDYSNGKFANVSYHVIADIAA